MAYRIAPERIKTIAVEFCTNGRNKSKALKAAGYSTNYSEHGGLKLFDDSRIKDEIIRIDAKTAAKVDITVEYMQEEHTRLAKKCEDKGDMVNATRNLEDLGKMAGVYKEHQINEILDSEDLTEAERGTLREMAAEYNRNRAVKPAKQAKTA